MYQSMKYFDPTRQHYHKTKVLLKKKISIINVHTRLNQIIGVALVSRYTNQNRLTDVHQYQIEIGQKINVRCLNIMRIDTVLLVPVLSCFVMHYLVFIQFY